MTVTDKHERTDVSNEIERHPVQLGHGRRESGWCPKTVTMRAYEVYCAIYGAQQAMVTGECRGGFSTGELIALLYAHSFPREQWSARVDEAMRGLEVSR